LRDRGLTRLFVGVSGGVERGTLFGEIVKLNLGGAVVDVLRVGRSTRGRYLAPGGVGDSVAQRAGQCLGALKVALTHLARCASGVGERLLGLVGALVVGANVAARLGEQAVVKVGRVGANLSDLVVNLFDLVTQRFFGAFCAGDVFVVFARELVDEGDAGRAQFDFDFLDIGTRLARDGDASLGVEIERLDRSGGVVVEGF